MAYVSIGATYGGNVWHCWNDNTSSSTTITWTNWNATSGTSSTSNIEWVWQTWNQPWNQGVTTRVYSTIDPEVLRAQREENARLMAAEQVEREAAVAKAEVLLRDQLTAEQLACLIKSDHFELLTGSGKRYRVNRGRAGNVQLLDAKGKPEARFCIHPIEWVPDPDTMLAQKLLLETDEEMFVRIANRTQLAAGR